MCNDKLNCTTHVADVEDQFPICLPNQAYFIGKYDTIEVTVYMYIYISPTIVKIQQMHLQVSKDCFQGILQWTRPLNTLPPSVQTNLHLHLQQNSMSLVRYTKIIVK